MLRELAQLRLLLFGVEDIRVRVYSISPIRIRFEDFFEDRDRGSDVWRDRLAQIIMSGNSTGEERSIAYLEYYVRNAPGVT